MGLEALFADALSAGTVPEDYTAVREEILSRAGAEEFLKGKAGIGGVSAAGGGVSTAGGSRATSQGSGGASRTVSGAGSAGAGAGQSETVGAVRARVLARAMLSWGQLGDYHAFRTSALVEALMKCGNRTTVPGLAMSQVPASAWTPVLMRLDRLDDVPPWVAPGRAPRPAVAGGSQPTSFTLGAVNGLSIVRGLGAEHDVPVLLEMAMKGPTGDLRAQLELVRPALPLLRGGRAIADAAAYRLWARAWAASRLQDSKEPDIVPILSDLMRADPEPEVRAYAATGLANRGAAAVEPLLAALSDENSGVRGVVCETLHAITGKQFEPLGGDARGTKLAAAYRAFWVGNKEAYFLRESGK
jgi:hypothetical protein